MESNQTAEAKESSKMNIQDCLSIGYIYLLILGVFHETIYYKFLNINILEYSSVLDVLISPVSVITGNLWLGLAIVFAIVFAFIYKLLIPKYYNFLSKRKKYQSGKYKERLDKGQAALKTNDFTIFLIALMVFSVFIGMGFGRGMKVKRKLKEDHIKYTHELTFEDNTTQKIKQLGKNSLYVFYITEPKGDVSISPIDGNIRTIKKLKEIKK